MPEKFSPDDMDTPEYRILRKPDGVTCVIHFKVSTTSGTYYTEMECQGRPRLPTGTAVKDSLRRGTRKFQLGGGFYVFHAGWHR